VKRFLCLRLRGARSGARGFRGSALQSAVGGGLQVQVPADGRDVGERAAAQPAKRVRHGPMRTVCGPTTSRCGGHRPPGATRRGSQQPAPGGVPGSLTCAGQTGTAPSRSTRSAEVRHGRRRRELADDRRAVRELQVDAGARLRRRPCRSAAALLRSGVCHPSRTVGRQAVGRQPSHEVSRASGRRVRAPLSRGGPGEAMPSGGRIRTRWLGRPRRGRRSAACRGARRGWSGGCRPRWRPRRGCAGGSAGLRRRPGGAARPGSRPSPRRPRPGRRPPR
jgi:hypothetical protein